MQAFLVLADSAQGDQASGKVSMLGGDWAIIGPEATSMAVIVLMRIPWEEAGEDREFHLRLVDEAGESVGGQDEEQGAPIRFSGVLRAAVEANLRDPLSRAMDIHANMAINIMMPQSPLRSGKLYTWLLEVEGKELASVTFAVRPAPEAAT